MTALTIDHSTLSRMVESGGVRHAHVVGQLGGWQIVVNADEGHSYILTAQRKGQARLFKKMDTLIGYLKGLGISQFAVDAAAFQPKSYERPDRSTALKLTHEAASHDKWIREQIEERLRMADSSDAAWIPHEEVKVRWAKKRAEILALIAGEGA